MVLLESSSETAIITTGGKRLTLHLDGKIVSIYVRDLAAKTLRLDPDQSSHYVVDGLINGNGTRFLVDIGIDKSRHSKTHELALPHRRRSD